MKTSLKSTALFFLLLSTLFFSSTAHAQIDYTKADSIAANFSETTQTVAELAQKLSASLSSDHEKARVFYMWLAHNVRYDCRKFHNRKKPNIKARSKAEYEKKRKALYDKQVLKTMKYKKGICGDYSRLYKALCDEVGLEAVYIGGYSRNFSKPYGKKQENSHAWNAVKIDGKWHLLDATWGAGYADAEVKKFTRRVSDGFFFVPPKWFAQTHFPKDEKWQLMDKTITMKDFPKQPMINFGQTQYPIINFAAQASTGSNKNKEVWLQFEETPERIMVFSNKGKPVKFEKSEKDGKIVLSFPNSAPRSINISGSKGRRSKFQWLAKYQL